MQYSKQQKHQFKIRSIYDILLKLQFPFDDDQVSSDPQQNSQSLNIKQIMMKVGKYIQGTQSRLILLEWIVNQYKPNKLNSKLNKNLRVENLVIILDQLGMLTITKNNKNMDYYKYVEGLLGFQASVNLIYKLVNFIKKMVQIRKRNRPDTHIVPMIKQLCQNKQQLVNINHDPFGITVPQQHSNLSQGQFNQKYDQLLYKIQSRKQRMNQNNKQIQIDESFIGISKQTKQRFKTTMTQMIDIISKLKQGDIPKYQQMERTRLVDVDGQFVNTYRKFNQIITFEQQKGNNSRNSYQKIKQAIMDL